MKKHKIVIPAIIKEIDYVLDFFATNSLAQPNVAFTDLFECLNELLARDSLPHVDNARLNRILDKLIKDGLVSRVDIGSGYNYQITYEGSLTHLLKGYQNKYLEAHQQILSKYREDKRATRLFWINFWIAFGALVAALYYLTKLYWEHGWFRFFSFCG